MNFKIALLMGTMGLSLSAYAEPGTDAAVPPPPAGAHEHHGPGGPGAPGEMKKMPELTDAQIVQIVQTTNDGEIAAARMEKNHGKNEEAKTFANGMIDQHTQNNKDLKELTKKLHMKPEKTPWSDKMHKEANVTGERLDKMKGADLDRAYMDKQVEMHRHVLDKLDTMLIPQAKNDDLKSFLRTTRETVSAHLDHALMLQKTVNGQTTPN